MESKWLASMRTFMSKINANLELDITGVPPTQRINDSHIMDMILGSEQKKKTKNLIYRAAAVTVHGVTRLTRVTISLGWETATMNKLLSSGHYPGG
jgi:hypothetical protein